MFLSSVRVLAWYADLPDAVYQASFCETWREFCEPDWDVMMVMAGTLGSGCVHVACVSFVFRANGVP